MRILCGYFVQNVGNGTWENLGLQNFLEGCYQNLPTPIETRTLAPKALMLAPFRLTKTSQFSLRRGWNISYFNLTCSYGPATLDSGLDSAATLDTKLV